MATHPLSLVAGDPELANRVVPLLKSRTGRLPSLATFESARSHLHPPTPGVLVLTVATADDAKQAVHLVQELSLRNSPLAVAVVEDGTSREGGGLEVLDPYVAGRFRWPGEEGPMADAVRKCLRQVPAKAEEEGGIVGEVRQRLLDATPSLAALAPQVRVAASHDVSVLITGETGTGKTFLARLIHDLSTRKNERFVAVPCGALSANLIESELFGHVKGAFTGADRPKVGKFEAAGRGTLLLDEIDALGLEQQAGLLRVVETGEYEPVGGNDTRVCAARLIVASNLDLEEAVREGKFREDLWYRLNVLSLYLPPLRERPQDVAALARGMAAEFNRKFHKELFEIHPDALTALLEFSWPGNIRQLSNLIQNAVLMSSGPRLLLEHLPPPLRQPAEVRSFSLLIPDQPPATVTPTSPALGGRGPAGAPLQEALGQNEAQIIRRALARNNFCRSRAAKELGISRVTLYKKMKKYGLQPFSELPAAE